VRSPSVARHFAWVFGVGALAFACSSTIKLGQDLPLAGGGGGASAAGTAGTLDLSGSSSTAGGGGVAAGGSGGGECHVTACQGKVFACGDCMDNDGDGLVDSKDPECTGPCDDTEDSFFGGIPGQNNAPCHEDCFFDQDTGSGNDQCFWNQACDQLSVAPSYSPSGDKRCSYDPAAKTPGTTASCTELEATQAAACLSYCRPLTPNGCDCFGCCELPADSGKFVWLGSSDKNAGTCNENTLSDPTACHPCTPVPSCFNRCDPCEVCVGRTTPSSTCGGSATVRCPVGQAACGQPNESNCDASEYCITGCCVPEPK